MPIFGANTKPGFLGGLCVFCSRSHKCAHDDLGMRKLPVTVAEELLEIVMRRYERASTLLTSNRPVEDLGQTVGRQRRRHRHARPLASSWSRAQMRSPELAHENRLASTGAGRVKQLSPRPLPLAGFALTTVGRF